MAPLSSQRGPLLALFFLVRVVLPTAAVKVGVYYGPKCSHCRSFLQTSVVPLIQAELPGDQVQITVMPVINGGGSSPLDLNFLAQVCAIESAFPMPAPADSPKLIAPVRFAICCLGTICDTMDKVMHCKSETGLVVDPLPCINKGLDTLTSGSYFEDPVAGQGHGFNSPVPWFVLDGQNQAGYDAEILGPVCAKLPAGTSGCPATGAQATTLAPQAAADAAVAQHKVCENCWEVGRFHWGSSTASSAWPRLSFWWPVAAVLGAGTIAVSAFRLFAWQHFHYEAQRGLVSEGDVELTLE
mmetsp:Transcript_95643/g.205214  ORF Transcript_95643/g.205214 Transcript_95643/m.205214 type:complete len:298 (-) Transcript_95643:201-1094(-)